jgi:hypothetical protein
MKKATVYFVGYFLGIPEKIKFIEYFHEYNIQFLEGSYKNTKIDRQRAIYYPEYLYSINIRKLYYSLTAPIEITKRFKMLYKRDYQTFRATLDLDEGDRKYFIYWLLYQFKQEKKKSRALFLYYIRYLFNIPSYYKSFRKTNIASDAKFIKFIFQLRFMSGYKYLMQLNDELQFDSSDIVLMWGSESSSRYLLLDTLIEKKIKYGVLEYGEISGTISCNTQGVFGNSDIFKDWEKLINTEVSERENIETYKVLDVVKRRYIAYQKYENSLLFVIQDYFKQLVDNNSIKRKKTVYVNGVELFASGLFFDQYGVESQGENPNSILLQYVVDYFSEDEYLVIYKEHPITIKQSMNQLLEPQLFPTVNFINNMNIHDALQMSDIVVSFPSKVVITALHYQKQVFVYGNFTFPISIPSMNYFTSTNFSDIVQMINNLEPYDDKIFGDIVSKMIKNNLVIYDQKLFSDYEFFHEKEKLQKLLEVLHNG